MPSLVHVAPTPRWERSAVVVPPPEPGPGAWAGAPSAVLVEDGVYLAYRLRRPVGEGRGYGNVIARSLGGNTFEPIGYLEKERFGAESLERPALVRTPDGRWRVYVSCATPGTKHWRVDMLEADEPEKLAAADPVTVLPGDHTYGVKDPVLRYDSGGNAHTPFSATLYVKLADGKSITFKTGATGWKGTRQANGNWTSENFDDSTWPMAIAYPGPTGLSGKDAGNPWAPGPVILLRHEFALSKPVVSARLYATALGAYKLQINGNTVGDQILAPGWMDFRHHVAYQAYDVTALVRSGANAIGAHVAPSWYSSPLTWVYQANAYGNAPPSLKAQLRVEHNDGSVEWINTDESWKADLSAIAEATIYDGEIFDARHVQKGWDAAGFSDGTWHAVQVSQAPGIKIEWQSFQPIRVQKAVTATSIANPSPGTYVFDFGQNMAGVARLQAKAPAATVVQLRFAEIVNSDGTIYVDNLRNAKATDIVTFAGDGVEEFQPDFTFHGFRYVELTGLPTKPTVDTLKALVFHTDAPLTAELQTGSKLINQLWSNIIWGQRSNFVGVPTDCPQRDERLGWTGDAQVFWRAAVYNMGLESFSRKFAGDLRGTQTAETAMYAHFAPGVYAENDGYAPGWADAGVIIPWTAWVQYGDKRIIEQNWDAMERYLASIEAANPDWLWKNALGIRYGDWLSVEGITAEDLLATAYWAYDSSRMAEMAHALGRSEDEKKYRDKFEKIKAAFIKAYVHEDGSVTANESSVGSIPTPGDAGRELSKETQTGYVLALHMDLLPRQLRAKAADHLLKLLEANHWRLGTGFLGTPYLLASLAETGHSDVAYRLLLTTEFPSWGYLVDHGATTMWERWNGDEKKSDPSMNSYNHYAYGAVADWIYRYAAGVDTDTEVPGFQTIRLHPTFSAELKQLDLSYESPYGRIQSAWTVEGTSARWHLTIPANATGELSLSKRDAKAYSLDGHPLIQNKKVRARNTDNGVDVYQIPSGTHRFEVKLSDQNERD